MYQDVMTNNCLLLVACLWLLQKHQTFMPIPWSVFNPNFPYLIVFDPMFIHFTDRHFLTTCAIFVYIQKIEHIKGITMVMVCSKWHKWYMCILYWHVNWYNYQIKCGQGICYTNLCIPICTLFFQFSEHFLWPNTNNDFAR